MRRPPLSVEQVLAWADDHFAHTGRWPTTASGPIRGAPGERWSAVQAALRRGVRGLPGGSSLARLLAERRGKRNKSALPRLSARQILRWAERHRARTGAWPGVNSGPVADAPGETWWNLDHALRDGWRGLPGGDSLARLLDRHRGPRPGSWRPWTDEEDEVLRALPPGDAAAHLRRTLPAVYYRRHTLGLPGGRPR